MGFLWLLPAFGAGLAIGSFLPWSPIAVICAVLIGAAWFPLRSTRAADFLLISFFLALGIAFYLLRADPPPPHHDLAHFVSEDPISVEGVVRTLALRSDGRWNIDLEARRILIKGSAFDVSGGVRIVVQEGVPTARPGDRLRFHSRLRLPRTFGTPGEFDYPRHLKSRGIRATGYVADARDLAVFADTAPGPRAALEGWRRQIARRIEGATGEDMAPLVKALVIGDKGGMTSAQRDILSRGGVSHLFSISGLHLGLIALFAFAAARFIHTRSARLLLLSPPRRLLPPLIVPLLFFYLLMSGDALPTRRAFLMVLGGAFLFCIDRRTPPLRLLAAVAFLVLLIEPLALFEPSFQLSFAGVLGIMVLLPRWAPAFAALPNVGKRGAELLLTTLAATIATAPFVLYHFHLIAPAGLLTNLAAVPLVGFLAVPLGLAGAALSSWWAQGSELCFQGCAFVLQGVLKGVEWTIGPSLLAGWKLYPSHLQAVGAGLPVLALLLPGGNNRRLFARGGLALLGLSLFLWTPPPSAGLTLTVLSVGQGEAMILSRPGDRHYLIDGGGLYGDTFDTGERLVAPALGRLGIRRLEAVILSHDHPDHSKGLLHILEHFPVKAFWSASPPELLNPPLQHILSERGIPAIAFPLGWTVLEEERGEEFSLYVPQVPGGNLNDHSLVVYCRLNDDGLLLTGDLEGHGVRNLLADPPASATTLLKLPHHGSRRSSPELLLESLQPQWAFVSAGAGNSYRFPHFEVVQDLQRRGIPLYRTDEHGTVRFRSRGEGWKAQRWERGLFR